MHEQFIQRGYDQSVIHVIEEAAESIVVACKILRFGRMSTNPMLPPEERETNEAALNRELSDLIYAIGRFNNEQEILNEKL